jgi:queuine tRNA-ribosyltransferase
MFRVEIKDKESKARTGLLTTPHGDIPTPIFMPVGTAGTVKGVLQRDLAEDINAKISQARH